MKKLITLLLALFVLNSCEQDPEIIGLDANKKMPKVDVCHYDADTDSWKTISINGNALQAHLDHGDFEGSCENRKTYVPDDTFEEYLICKGYDDVMDDYVLTSKIDKIEALGLPHDGGSDCPGFGIKYISDLTGLEDFISLKYLSTAAGTEKVLDLSTLTHLEELRIYAGSQLETLNISNCLELKRLYVGDPTNLNALSILDITNNINLEIIYLSSLYYLEHLDFSRNTKLKSVDLDVESYIMNIDLSNASLLEKFSYVQGYQANPSINLRNMYNKNILSVYIKAFTPICVQVDNAEYANENWAIPNSEAYFSEDCGY